MNAHQKVTMSLPIHPTRRHPLTGEPLRAIGFHPKTGAPRWPIMGGAEDDPPPATDWTTTFEGQTPAQVLAALTTAQQKAQAADKWANVFTDLEPEKVKEKLDHASKWETRARGNVAKATQFDKLVSDLGLTPKEGEGDPNDKDPKVTDETVTTLVQQKDAQNATLAREVAVLRHAPTGVDGKALVDSRTFMETVAKLDPTADDFTDKLGEAIKTVVDGDDGARFQLAGPDGRPRRDPRQGKESDGKTGTTESGRTAYQERKKKRTYVGSTN